MAKRNIVFLMAQLLSVLVAFGKNPTGGNAEVSSPIKEEASSVPFVIMLLVVLVLIAILAFFGWRYLRKLREELKEYKGLLREVKSQSDMNSQQIDSLNKLVKQGDSSLRDLKSGVDESSRHQSEMQEQKEEDKLSKEVLDSVDPQPEKIVQIRYLSLPKDGVFDLGCEVYKTGKVLFVLTAQDDKGTFEFCSKPDSINYVRRGRDVLDLACVVQNGRVASFSNIVTDVPGTVIRVENGWKIKEKAKVHFEN